MMTETVHQPDLPSTKGAFSRQIKVLLINPNSTASMTQACLNSITSSLPSDVTVYGFTAPRPSPSAVEGQVDAILSTAACLRAVVPIATHYDAFLVACFSAHPLINALREEVTQPVMGIMEAALYASRICGSRLGVLTTSPRSKILHDDSIRHYGLSGWSVGCESANLGVLELESKPQEEVLSILASAAKKLVDIDGADCVCLGCAGMTNMREACEQAVGMDQRRAMIVDGVGVGVHFLTGLVRERLGTAKRGSFMPAMDGRLARGQDWY